jgi:ZIP family zinc transporter
MNELTQIILFTTIAGTCIPVGGYIASKEKLKPRWLESEFRHSIIAFGGGILIAAVALVLVPEGMKYFHHPIYSVLILLFGGICFFVIENFLGKKHQEKPQFMAMLLDFIPESLALGGVFALGAPSAVLLAVFIAFQNISEGFNAFHELRAHPKTPTEKILRKMLFLVPIGPIIALLGFYYLSHYTPVLGAIMLFSSGGILYLIFQDIAPQAKMQRHWAPPLGAVLGFGVGMLGNNIILGW